MSHDQVPTTYIGIAYHSKPNDHHYHSVLVLSKFPSFQIIDMYGTVIDTVNGWVERWWESGKPPVPLEPYLVLGGIMPFAKVNRPAMDIAQSIFNLQWNASGASAHTCGGLKYRFPDHYVRQTLIGLHRDGIFRLPGRFDIVRDFDTYTMYCLTQLMEMRKSRPNLLHLVSVEDLLQGRK